MQWFMIPEQYNALVLFPESGKSGLVLSVYTVLRMFCTCNRSDGDDFGSNVCLVFGCSGSCVEGLDFRCRRSDGCGLG